MTQEPKRRLTNPELRKAKIADWDYILYLRNSSFKFFEKQRKPLSKGEHYRYMIQQLKNPKFAHYFYKEKCYVRILDNDIGVITDPKYRMNGLATEAIVKVAKLHPNLFAKIHLKNNASFDTFAKASRILSSK